MGRIYNNIKAIWSKEDNVYSMPLIEKFIVLLTFEDTYLMKKFIYNHDKSIRFVVRNNGNDLYIDCINFGILITPKDKISIHT